MFVLFTPPTLRGGNETARYNPLFEKGLHCLVLRLDSASKRDYEEAILGIAPQYRTRVIICDHFELVLEAGLGGAHLNKAKRILYPEVSKLTWRITTSTHSFEELQSLPFRPTFAFLSPVYDSICKIGYKGGIALDRCPEELAKVNFPVVALGGITPELIKEVLTYRFAGAAAMGYFYERHDALLEAFLRFSPPSVLSIAGHDPTSGAGIVADALNIEYLGGYPLTIPAVSTIQHEMQFICSYPVELQRIRRTLRHLYEWHRCQVAKIGLMGGLREVAEVAQCLRDEHVREIVWDPVVKPTKGVIKLHDAPDAPLLQKIAKSITVLTPNEAEAVFLFGDARPETLLEASASLNVSILLTGRKSIFLPKAIEDTLYQPDGTITHFRVPRVSLDKHGTGCALSSAIAVRLAQGYDLRQACQEAQWYVAELINSDSGLLARRSGIFGERKARSLRSFRLQYITDNQEDDEIIRKVEKALHAGIRWIQLRMKSATHEECVAVAKRIMLRMEPYDEATLIINDNVEAVLESNAHGVHLGLKDLSPVEARRMLGPNRIIGGTCNTVEDLRQRALEGVDYVGVGPFGMTHTKTQLSSLLGVEGLMQLMSCAASIPHSFPLVAIGGIEAGDLPLLQSTGISGVALSGAINRAEDPYEAAKALYEQAKLLWP